MRQRSGAECAGDARYREQASVHDDDPVSNPSANRHFGQVLQANLLRRRMLRGGLAAAAATFLPRPVAFGAGPKPLIGFRPVPASRDDAVHVPAGYVAQVLYRWGDPVSDGPAFAADASNPATDQEVQAGMHHDGMHFFALPAASHGLLAINHEYVDDGLLHPDGMKTWSAQKVRKAQAAHGVSVIEVMQRAHGAWSVVRPSRYARRITARTPMRLSGPAAGHDLMRTAADLQGRLALGTFNNCAHGTTPWGTYLTCEENFHYYFV